MAYIVSGYQKTGQMLILDPRERFIYPFNLGDYSEIRFGMYFSATAATGDNATVSANDWSTKRSARDSVYIGFCNFNTGLLLPLQTGFDFIGCAALGDQTCGITVQSVSDSYIRLGAVGNGNGQVFLADTTGAVTTPGILTVSDAIARFPTNSVGFANYAGMFGLQLGISGANLCSMRAFGNNVTYTTNPSLTNLRTDVSTLGQGTSSLSSVVTGYYTSGGTNNNNVMMKPNAIFIYTPQFNSRLRIHALVVERYA